MSKGAGKGARSRPCTCPPRMPPALNCDCTPYNDAWLPHRLSGYGDCVCSFCHAKHWVEEKQQSSSLNSPMFTLCCHAGKVCSIQLLGFRTPVDAPIRYLFHSSGNLHHSSEGYSIIDKRKSLDTSRSTFVSIIHHLHLHPLVQQEIQGLMELCNDIAIFSLYFSLCRSVPLLPLHSAPSPTHDPPIFQYFIDRHCASRFSALPC